MRWYTRKCRFGARGLGVGVMSMLAGATVDAAGRPWTRDDGTCQVSAGYRPDKLAALGAASDEASLRSHLGEGSLLVFENRTEHPIQIVWLDYNGQRDARPRPAIAPGASQARCTFEGHPFVVLDTRGHAMCTVRADASDRVAVIDANCIASGGPRRSPAVQ